MVLTPRRGRDPPAFREAWPEERHRCEDAWVRLYLIGEVEDAPLHVALEVAEDLAYGLVRIHGYRFVTRRELEALPHGREALRAWRAGDDTVFEARTRAFAEEMSAEEDRLDSMSDRERAAHLRDRLLAAGLEPARVEEMLRERRRRGLRIAGTDPAS